MALTAGQKFAQVATMKFFEQAVTPEITHDKYEMDLSGGGADRAHIKTYFTPEIVNYDGVTPMTAEDAADTVGELLLNQKKAFYFTIESIQQFEDWLGDPEHEINRHGLSAQWEVIDAFTLGLWPDTASGNWDGTSYTTGTVTVDVTTGAVTGSGTTFTAGMVGKPFKAVGHTKWYRVKTFSSTTAIVIEDDLDDETSAYTGGAIGAGAAYEIQANTAIQVTKSNFYARMLVLAKFLNEDKIPRTERWAVLPAWLESLALQAPEFIPAVAAAYEDVVLNASIGRMAGFRIYLNQQVAGDEVNGSHIMAGHKSAIAFALAFKEDDVEPAIGLFGKRFKSLFVYGGKVVDERRKALAHGFWKA